MEMDFFTNQTTDNSQPFQSSPQKFSNSFLIDLQDIGDWEIKTKRESNYDGLRLPLAKKTKSSTVIDSSVRDAEKRALEEIGTVNWVGRLHEYRMTRLIDNQKVDPEYIEDSNYSLSFPRFSCAVMIPEDPQRFGGGHDSITFAAKKPAKQFAAKKAVDWLIANNFMPADGSVRFPKSKFSSRCNPQSYMSPGSVSYTAQVPTLCHRLGFCLPRYIIEPLAPGSPLYNAHADFGADPRIDGPVGIVRNIYGKKKAKEEVAKIIVPFMKNIEKLRLSGSHHTSYQTPHQTPRRYEGRKGRLV
ncbi:hypothetical protein K3495_g5399 [Podosphaera aphanis]|nr:hypothetical protein K3495_g5399 [Podosphaera aphanis]